MIARLGTALLALLISIDVLLCALWLAPLYVAGLADKPTGRELISGYVGKAVANGHRWAQPVARVIDWIFGEGHCARVYAGGEG